MAAMHRYWVALLFAPAVCAPVGAQDFGAGVARAQEKLDQIVKLVDAMQTRQARAAEAANRQELFDGKTLAGWTRTEFAGGGGVRVEPDFRGGGPAIVVEAGDTLSGITWSGAPPPKTGYEISLEMMKVEGSDFACGLTFPVAESHASLILGGWGGGVVGVSSIDGMDASQNETTKYMGFTAGRWYTVRLRVTPGKIQVWLDGKPIVDADIAGKKISLRHGEIYRSTPLGLATFQTIGAYRALRLRRLGG
ncbi:MAG: DUF1080 domain-containing protein [Armatimonadetes bacterium]|nr:DUF1080 domain-containing protein [Armatimonadota bacterium]